MLDSIVPIKIRRVHLDKQGYSKVGGEYFGVGLPLYMFWNDDVIEPYIHSFVRAGNLQQAKIIIKKELEGKTYWSNEIQDRIRISVHFIK